MKRKPPVTRRLLIAVAGGCLVASMILGCGSSNEGALGSSEATPGPTTTSSASPCADVEGSGADLSAEYRTKGEELAGDVDGDGRDDRVSLREDESRPARCEYLVAVEIAAGRTIVAPVAPLSWPGTDPDLVLLAEVDGRAGLEPVVALSPEAVYQPGAVFTTRDGELRRMRLVGSEPDDLFPFDDEFPAGVDCAAEPGAIVVTGGDLADGGTDDRHWDITRSFYRVAGSGFELIRDEEFRVEVGSDAEQRWPELGGDPFVSCAVRID